MTDRHTTNTTPAALNRFGADQAATIRDAAAQLAEIDNLRQTSALRELLLDLSYALANLSGPVGALVDAWAETAVGTDPAERPDSDALVDLAAWLRYCADNT